MAKAQDINPSTRAVQAHRARAAKLGMKPVYASVDKDAHEALQTIMVRRVCTMREALEYAIKKTARELTRTR
jgi:hypothetical protein